MTLNRLGSVLTRRYAEWNTKPAGKLSKLVAAGVAAGVLRVDGEGHATRCYCSGAAAGGGGGSGGGGGGGGGRCG